MLSWLGRCPARRALLGTRPQEAQHRVGTRWQGTGRMCHGSLLWAIGPSHRGTRTPSYPQPPGVNERGARPTPTQLCLGPFPGAHSPEARGQERGGGRWQLEDFGCTRRTRVPVTSCVCSHSPGHFPPFPSCPQGKPSLPSPLRQAGRGLPPGGLNHPVTAPPSPNPRPRHLHVPPVPSEPRGLAHGPCPSSPAGPTCEPLKTLDAADTLNVGAVLACQFACVSEGVCACLGGDGFVCLRACM